MAMVSAILTSAILNNRIPRQGTDPKSPLDQAQIRAFKVLDDQSSDGYRPKPGLSVLAARTHGGKSLSFSLRTRKGDKVRFLVAADDSGHGVGSSIVTPLGEELATKQDQTVAVSSWTATSDGSIHVKATNSSSSDTTLVCAILLATASGGISKESWDDVFEQATLDPEDDKGFDHLPDAWFLYGGVFDKGSPLNANLTLPGAHLKVVGLSDGACESNRLVVTDGDGKTMATDDSSVEGDDIVEPQVEFELKLKQQAVISFVNVKGDPSFAGISLLQTTK